MAHRPPTAPHVADTFYGTVVTSNSRARAGNAFLILIFPERLRWKRAPDSAPCRAKLSRGFMVAHMTLCDCGCGQPITFSVIPGFEDLQTGPHGGKEPVWRGRKREYVRKYKVEFNRRLAEVTKVQPQQLSACGPASDNPSHAGEPKPEKKPKQPKPPSF